MPNPENLIKNTDRTPSERKEIASRAGKASGVKRRQNRNIKEAMKQLLSEKIKSGALPDDPRVKAIMEAFGLSEEDKVTTLAAASIIAETISGSAPHAKLVLEMTDADGESERKPAKIIVQLEDNSEETSV